MSLRRVAAVRRSASAWESVAATMWIERVLPFVLIGCFFILLVYNRMDVHNASQLHSMLYRPNCSDSTVQVYRKNTYSKCLPHVANVSLFKPSGNEAFFIETSLSSSLNYRQACSIESLALSNPNLTVNVLMTGNPIDFNSTTMSVLENYTNINIVPIAPADLFIGTPLEHWFFRTDWFTSPYSVEHLADALRYVILFKYGGYYFDLDVIIMRSITEYRNFSALQGGEVAIGAMHFDYNHPVIVALVEEFRISYNKNYWSHAGPGAITRVLKKYCNMEAIDDASLNRGKSCKSFTIYPPETFYPIPYSYWELYFRNGSDVILTLWDRTKVMGAHVWNKLSARQPVYKESKQLYSQLARLYCPAIFSAAPNSY